MEINKLIQHAENAEVLVRFSGHFYPITKAMLHGLGTIIEEDVDGTLFYGPPNSEERSFTVKYYTHENERYRVILYRTSEGDKAVMKMVPRHLISEYAWISAITGMYGGDEVEHRAADGVHDKISSTEDNANLIDALFKDFKDDELTAQNPDLIDLINNTESDLLVKKDGVFHPLTSDEVFRIGTEMAVTIVDSGSANTIPNALANGEYWNDFLVQKKKGEEMLIQMLKKRGKMLATS